ncbi:recombination-associated protein RdgC [Vibrio sp. S9_S30]|nr:recombination-associated protein RdgC [Vibrio sp. S9_S30]
MLEARVEEKELELGRTLKRKEKSDLKDDIIKLNLPKAFVTSKTTFAVIMPELAIKYGLNYETTSFYQHSGKVGAQDAKFHQLIFDSSRITRRSGLPCLYEVAWKPVVEEQRLWMAGQVFHSSLQ